MRLDLLLGSAKRCLGSTRVSLCGWKGVLNPGGDDRKGDILLCIPDSFSAVSSWSRCVNLVYFLPVSVELCPMLLAYHKCYHLGKGRGRNPIFV